MRRIPKLNSLGLYLTFQIHTKNIEKIITTNDNYAI